MSILHPYAMYMHIHMRMLLGKINQNNNCHTVNSITKYIIIIKNEHYLFIILCRAPRILSYSLCRIVEYIGENIKLYFKYID